MSAGSYLAGWAAIITVVAALGWGAWWLRQALLPDWSGAPARLAEIVVALAVPIGLAQLLGSFGGFRRGPMFFGCVAVAVVIGLTARRWALTAHAGEPRPSSPSSILASPREEVVVAALAAAVVAGQWATRVATAWGRGMTDGDSLWYHAPFAARFVQTGKLTGLSSTGLEGLGQPLHTYLPLNSSLVHALVMLPFGNDFLSPVVNLGWAALALLAAWCIGRRAGAGALSVLGAVVVLALPTFVATQPGQASNDLATAALFFAAIALLLEGGLAPAPTGLAAVSAGLALGTKLTVATPIALLTVGIVVLALRARRPVTVLTWCGGLALSGGYWFVRNWVVGGNPLPYFELELGPISLESEFGRHASILDFVTDTSVWRRFFLPGLSEALGWTWPLLLVLALVGALVAILRGRRPLERLAGGAVLAGVAGYVAIPGTGDLGGGLFVFTLRYLTPILLTGFALLALSVEGVATRWRRALWLAMSGLVVAQLTAGRYDGIPAWAGDETVVGVLVAVAVVVAVVAGERMRTRATAARLGGAMIVAALLAAGWIVQDHFFDRRYVAAGLPLDGANAVFRDVQDEKVAVFGTEQLYPMFGLDLSNRVSKVAGPDASTDAELCAGWREELAAGGYRYIVLGRQPLTDRGPAEEWVNAGGVVTQVFRDRDAVVYRVDGVLDPAGCP